MDARQRRVARSRGARHAVLFSAIAAAALWAQPGAANRADLDLTFGVDGVVELQLLDSSSFLDIEVQADGRIVGVGYAGTGAARQWAVVRFESDGSLDTGFGSNGVVVFTPPGATEPTPPNMTSEPTIARSLAFDASGNILVVGGNAVVRLTPAGALDTSYGNAGVYLLPPPTITNPYYGLPGPFVRDIAPDGSGGFLLSGAIYYLEGAYYYAEHASVTRLTAAGVADTGFGSGGGTAYLLGNYSPRTFSSAYQTVVSGGAIYFADYEWDRELLFRQPHVRKLLADGTFDSTFGASIPFFSGPGGMAFASSIVKQSDSLFIVGGVKTEVFFHGAAVSRVTAGGQRDPTFTEFNLPGLSSHLAGTPTLLVDPDARILMAGWETAANGPLVAGLLPDGMPDPDFGVAGIASLSAPFAGSSGVALARQSDGKYLVAAGGDQGTAAARMYVARLRGSAVIPPLLDLSPQNGVTLSAPDAPPGTRQTLGILTFDNRGGDPLIVGNCAASSGFQVSGSFPLNIASGTSQSVVVSCNVPSTPFTTSNGTLTCSGINDAAQPTLSYPLVCRSGSGTGSVSAVPGLSGGMRIMLGLGLALLALAGLGRYRTRSFGR